MQKGYTFSANETVTAAKLHALVNGATLEADDVETNHIQNSAVTGPKLADGAVDANKLAASQKFGTQQYATVSGTDTYTATLSPAPASYLNGMILTLRFTNANTAAATLNTNSLGAKNIYKNGAALVAGDIQAGMLAVLAYNSTDDRFDMVASTFMMSQNQRYDAEQYAATSGTDAYTATLSPVPTSYVTGMAVTLLFGNANTGAATINLNSLGAKTIQKNGSALAAGDIPANSTQELRYDGTNFQLVNRVTIPSGGKVAQVVEGKDSTYSSSSAAIPEDNTIPQITEGVEVASVSITPTNASSKILLEYEACVAPHSTDPFCMAVFQSGVNDALDSAPVNAASGNAATIKVKGMALVDAGSTSSRTYSVRVGTGNASTFYINGDNSSAKYGGTAYSRIIAMEILP